MATKRSYTIEYKLQVVERLKVEFNNNISAASRDTGVDRKRIREWVMQEEALAKLIIISDCKKACQM